MKTSRKLNFGLLGLGRFGKHYARLLNEAPGVKLARTADNAKTAHQILADAKIDCVVIATPPATHFELAMHALKYGKHVLVEKPMVQNIGEAKRLAHAVKKSGRIFMVGHQYLYNDFIRILKKTIESGKLGGIRYVLAEQLSLGPLRQEGDCFWECATHEVALLDHLFKPFGAVRATGQSAAFSPKMSARDFAVVSLALPKKVLATIVVSLYAPEKVRKLTIAGNKGFAIFDDCEPKNKLRLAFHRYPIKKFKRGSLFLPQGAYKTLIPHVAAQEPLHNQLEHFLECIRKNKTPLTDINHGLRVTKQLHEASHAIQYV